MTKYYIPLDSKNLSAHFTNGYISPQRYQKNEKGDSIAHNDVQSIYDKHLLVTTFLYADASNCSLEIIFTEAEKNELIKIGNNGSLFLFEKCLPLSRVKQVIFRDNEKLKRTVANINIGGAFLRSSMLKEQDEPSIAVSEILLKCKSGGAFLVNTIPNEDMLDKYSRMLSAFSLMRVITPTDNEYPLEYIDFFSQLSSQVFSNGSLTNVNIHDGAMLQNLLRLTQNAVEGENIPTNTAGVYDLEKIQDDKIFLKAFLLKYGNGPNAKHKIDDFIDHLVNQKKGLKELPAKLAFYLGYRENYSALKNKYNIGNREVSVKFKLDSKFDFYLLESLYQLVFNSIEQSGKFTYLDYWIPEFVNIDSFEGYESELVLGKLIKGKKKQTPLEYLQRFSPEFLQDFSKIYKVIYLSCTAEIDQSDEKAKKRISFFTDKLESHFLELLNNFTRKVDDKLQEDCNENLNKKELEIKELKFKLDEKESIIMDLEKKLAESDKRVVGFSLEQKEDDKIVENHNGITNNVSTVTSNILDTATKEYDNLDKHDQFDPSQEHADDMEQSSLHYEEQSPEENKPSKTIADIQAALLLKNIGNTGSEESFRKKLKNKKKDILIACINQLKESNSKLNDLDTSDMTSKQLIDYIVTVSPALNYK
jgi:hypothetical protein